MPSAGARRTARWSHAASLGGARATRLSSAVSPSSPTGGRHGARPAPPPGPARPGKPCRSEAGRTARRSGPRRSTGRRERRGNSGRVALLPPPRATRLSGAARPEGGTASRRRAVPTGARTTRRSCGRSTRSGQATGWQPCRPTGIRRHGGLGRSPGKGAAGPGPGRPTGIRRHGGLGPVLHSGGRSGAVPPHGDRTARRLGAHRPQGSAQPVRAVPPHGGGTARRICGRTPRQRPGGRLEPHRPTGVGRHGGMRAHPAGNGRAAG